jgi:hypothetical protein
MKLRKSADEVFVSLCGSGFCGRYSGAARFLDGRDLVEGGDMSGCLWAVKILVPAKRSSSAGTSWVSPAWDGWFKGVLSRIGDGGGVSVVTSCMLPWDRISGGR